MRSAATALLLLTSLFDTGVADIAVDALSGGRNTFWLSGPATQVCFSVAPGDNPAGKALRFTTTGGRVEYTQSLPAEASACVALSIPLNASMSIVPHTLAVVATDRVLASTAPFNVSAAIMVASHRTYPTNVSITVIATFSNKEERRLTDVMRIVGKDEVVAGECLCYPTGFISPTQLKAKCSFDIRRNTSIPTRGPYTMRFYSDNNPRAVAVQDPKPLQTAQWLSLGI